MKFSITQLNKKIDEFLLNALKIKSEKLRKAILWVLYLAFFIFAFGLLPFIFGFYLVLVIWSKINSPKLKYALSAVVLLFTISVGTAWARVTYDKEYRESISAQQASSEVEEPKAVGGVETKVEVKEEIKTETIAFETRNENDPNLEKGQTKVKQEGKDGIKEIKYEVTYTDGKETGRKLISETVTVQSIPKIVLVGTKVTPPPTQSTPSDNQGSGYTNVDGIHVPSPSDNPTGATARCRDGKYSYSQHRQGTCSGHGGVAEWL